MTLLRLDYNNYLHIYLTSFHINLGCVFIKSPFLKILNQEIVEERVQGFVDEKLEGIECTKYNDLVLYELIESDSDSFFLI